MMDDVDLDGTAAMRQAGMTAHDYLSDEELKELIKYRPKSSYETLWNREERFFINQMAMKRIEAKEDNV